MKLVVSLLSLIVAWSAHAKTFQNSYVAFDVPDNWTCLQEGVAWICTPQGAVESKEAVIVIVAKVAGPEDNLPGFLNYLKQPKKITTRVGTPMPSRVMYAQQRSLAGINWVQAQHLGSEIQEYYTLYLATVKDQLAILVNFSAERNRYQVYNPVFDKAIKTLRIVASQQLLFSKNKTQPSSEVIGINVQDGLSPIDSPPPAPRKMSPMMLLFGLAILVFLAAVFMTNKRKKISHSKNGKTRSQ